MTPDEQLNRLHLPESLSVDALQNPRTLEKRRAELKEQLQREEYGFLPPSPETLTFEEIGRDEVFCAGKAPLIHMRASMRLYGQEFSFPFHITVPVRTDRPCPAVLHINFRPDVPDKYMPSEEIIDRGVAVFSFGYLDVTPDYADMTRGLAAILAASGQPVPGKLMMWAWAAMRVMDYIVTRPEIDTGRVLVAGHSRLGKTALLAGAFDERFWGAYSNDSGCCGAALFPAKPPEAEHIANITGVVPQWFTPSFSHYAGRDDSMPFDQHFLTALLFPRRLYIASAAEDLWAAPENEYLGLLAADRLYRAGGYGGMVQPGRMPVSGDVLRGERTGYHLRAGRHYFSREDWGHLLDFLLDK